MGTPWVFGVETEDRKTRDALREYLAACGIETRNYFFPLHLEPVNFYGDDAGVYDVLLANAEHVAQVGFYLPTHSFLEHSDVEAICQIVSYFYDGRAVGSIPSLPRSVGWADAERT